MTLLNELVTTLLFTCKFICLVFSPLAFSFRAPSQLCNFFCSSFILKTIIKADFSWVWGWLTIMLSIWWGRYTIRNTRLLVASDSRSYLTSIDMSSKFWDVFLLTMAVMCDCLSYSIVSDSSEQSSPSPLTSLSNKAFLPTELPLPECVSHLSV